MGNKIVTYTMDRDRRVRGTNVAKGQVVYAIQDQTTKWYFTWSYTIKSYAEVVAERVSPRDNMDLQFNWRKELTRVIPTDRNSD